MKYPFCSVSFTADMSLEEVAALLSRELFGNVPFKDRDWNDEVPFCQLCHKFLGLDVRVLQKVSVNGVPSAPPRFSFGFCGFESARLPQPWPPKEELEELLEKRLELVLSGAPRSVLWPNALDLSEFVAARCKLIDGIRDIHWQSDEGPSPLAAPAD